MGDTKRAMSGRKSIQGLLILIYLQFWHHLPLCIPLKFQLPFEYKNPNQNAGLYYDLSSFNVIINAPRNALRHLQNKSLEDGKKNVTKVLDRNNPITKSHVSL